MSDLKLALAKNDPNLNDLLIENNDLVLVDAKEAIVQHILQRLRTFLGEWFLDTTIGVPYFQQILIKNPDKAKIQALLLDVIRNTPGVDTLSNYAFGIDTASRVFNVSFRATTTSGIIDYAGLING